MAETQTAPKPTRSAPKTLAEKDAEYTAWKAARALRDMKKSIKGEIAKLVDGIDAAKSVEEIARTIEAFVDKEVVTSSAKPTSDAE